MTSSANTNYYPNKYLRLIAFWIGINHCRSSKRDSGLRHNQTFDPCLKADMLCASQDD